MEFIELRLEIVEAGRRMREAGLVVATEGNLSVRATDDLVITTPAGADKGLLEVEDLCVVRLDGSSVAGPRPSTELPMHLAVYEERADVRAVAHGHPPHATAFAVAHRALDGCLMPEVIVTLGRVPLSEYGTPSTDEVPAAVRAVVRDHDAFLLRNHGVVATGKSIRSALYALETVERLAQVTWLAESIGGGKPITAAQVKRLMEVRAVYGEVRDVPPCRPAEGEGASD